MASGRPIFGPATPDLQEVLKSGLNAVLVEPDDYDVALEALEALLKSDETLEELGRQAAYDVQAMTWDNRAVRVRDFMVEHMNRLADRR
jgi:glycosyltransferase involved in cell wall biosynthesis